MSPNHVHNNAFGDEKHLNDYLYSDSKCIMLHRLLFCSFTLLCPSGITT